MIVPTVVVSNTSKTTISPPLCLNNIGNLAVTQNGALIYQQNFILQWKHLNQDSDPLPRLHLPVNSKEIAESSVETQLPAGGALKLSKDKN